MPPGTEEDSSSVGTDIKMFAVNINVPASFEKLEGAENYMNWKFAMEAHLFNVELWDYIDGSKSDERQGKRARGAIISGVKSHLFSSIRDSVSGREVWEKFEKLFQPSGLYREVALLEELTSIRYSDCADMEAYLNKKVTAAQKLRAINSEVKDRLLAGLILMKLPEEFNPLIQSISNQDKEISTEAVREKLLAEAARQDAQKKESALAGRHLRFGQRNFSGQKKQFRTPFKGKCNRCKTPGHMAKDCHREREAQGQVAEVLDPHERLERVLKCSADCSNEWIIDSGASAHMTSHRDLFVSISEDGRHRSVATADNTILKCEGTGDVKIACGADNRVITVRLREVLYVPGLSVNLISVKQLCSRGCTVSFDDKLRCEIRDRLGELCATATGIGGGLYRLDTCWKPALAIKATDGSCAAEKVESYELWHRRLGHLHREAVQKMSNGVVRGINCVIPKERPVCQPCAMGKQKRNPFPRSETRARQKLELVHSDVCGPMPTPSVSGSRYFVTFVDDHTRYTTVYFMKSKSEVHEKILQFIQSAERATGCKLKTLRTDNGSEYLAGRTSGYLREIGVRHETTVQYTPEQNGRAEIVNKILVEKARCMLADAHLGKQFWAEALNTACWLKNVSSTASLESVSPLEAWSGRKPNLRYLRIFGCLALAHVPKEKRRKWDPKSRAYIFVGYCDSSKAYRLIPLNDKTSVVKSRDVIFDESRMAARQDDWSASHDRGEEPEPNDDPETNMIIRRERISPSSSRSLRVPEDVPESVTGDTQNIGTGDADGESDTAEPTEQIGDSPALEENTTAEIDAEQPSQETRTSNRCRKPPLWHQDYNFACGDTNGDQCHEILGDADTPKTVNEALSGPNAEQWQEAMDREMKAHNKNETWRNIERPAGEKVITSKWVFKIKRSENGGISLFKARLVARGCSQVQGIDFDENFSPVVKIVSLRTLFACAARNSWSVFQLDIETAYLHGILKERVLMETPEGYEQNGKVCLLQKSLYGLRQAGRRWFERLRESLCQMGLGVSEADPCLFHLKRNGRVIIVTVYVDDILVFTDSEGLRKEVCSSLSKLFPVKNLGLAKFCLGIHITQQPDKKLILLSQKEYISQLLKRFNMADAKPAITPMEVNLKLVKRSSPIEDQGEDGARAEPYREAVGCLIHLSQITRPDICHAVGVVSKFSSNPSREHWMAVKRIFRYLKGSQELVLKFNGRDRKCMEAFADADWGGCNDCRRSTTGYCVVLSGACISWNSRKQPTVALSSTEAEYMSIGAVAQEIKWLLNLQELFPREIRKPFRLWNDNQGAILLSGNAVHHKRTKHVDLRHHFVRDMVSAGQMEIKYLPTNEMVADILTKSLGSVKFNQFRVALGLHPAK